MDDVNDSIKRLEIVLDNMQFGKRDRSEDEDAFLFLSQAIDMITNALLVYVEETTEK